MGGHVKIQPGDVYNGVEVLYRLDNNKHYSTMWRCRCTCGNEFTVKATNLTRGITRSCGCLRKKVALAKLSKRKTLPGARGFKIVQRSYTFSAGYRGLEFSLTDVQFRELLAGNCHYCGVEPLQVSRDNNKKISEAAKENSAFVYNGIDRVDNAKGYTAENCVTCCKCCNKAKLSMSQDEFLSWIKRVYDHNFSPKVSSDSTDKNSGGAE
jgi:hypothetical protein